MSIIRDAEHNDYCVEASGSCFGSFRTMQGSPLHESVTKLLTEQHLLPQRHLADMAPRNSASVYRKTHHIAVRAVALGCRPAIVAIVTSAGCFRVLIC